MEITNVLMKKFPYIENQEILEFLYEFNTDGSKINADNSLLSEMEEYAVINSIPIVTRDVANFLKLITAALNPENILEVGTAIGYSAINMAKSASDEVNIDSIEIDDKIIKRADYYIKKANLSKNINIICGDGVLEIPKLEKRYDMVFIDASKSHYSDFFEKVIYKLNKNYLLIFDNILFRGLICTSFENVPRKHRTIYNNLKEFLKKLYKNKNYQKAILPIGDGLLVVSGVNDRGTDEKN